MKLTRIFRYIVIILYKLIRMVRKSRQYDEIMDNVAQNVDVVEEKPKRKRRRKKNIED